MITSKRCISTGTGFSDLKLSVNMFSNKNFLHYNDFAETLQALQLNLEISIQEVCVGRCVWGEGKRMGLTDSKYSQD